MTITFILEVIPHFTSPPVLSVSSSCNWQQNGPSFLNKSFTIDFYIYMRCANISISIMDRIIIINIIVMTI